MDQKIIGGFFMKKNKRILSLVLGVSAAAFLSTSAVTQARDVQYFQTTIPRF